MEVDSINHFKSVFAHQCFARAADHNYVVARWARIVGLTRESFIQAHQAIEKYLKAALVLNDVSVYNYKHDIVEMFLRHQEVFQDIAVTDLEKPGILNDELWREWSALKFVQHLEINGNPNSRYRLTSFYCYSSDIFMLDELVRQLRRLTIGINWKVGEDFPVSAQLTDSIGLTYREALNVNPSLQVRGDILDEAEMTRELNPTLRDALMVGNVALFKDLGIEHRKVPSTVASWLGPIENSYLYLLAQALRDRRADQKVRDGTKWITDNIYLPRSVQRELQVLSSQT